MGCNTSKDSVEPHGENKGHDEESNREEKGKQENQINTNNISGIPHEAEDPSVTSASNRQAGVTAKSASGDQSRKSDQFTENSSLNTALQPDVDEEQAATKIQAVFRGHKARQSMKQPTQSGSGEPVKNNSSTMAEEAKEDVEELEHAATKIQATFRGHLTRKHEAEKKGENESTSSKGDVGKSNEEEELDIDLTDPDLNKAAVKIQASFRGHMVRKENEDEQEQNAAVSK